MYRTTQPKKKIESVAYSYPNGDIKYIKFNKPLLVREAGWELVELEEEIVNADAIDNYYRNLYADDPNGITWEWLPDNHEANVSDWKKYLESLSETERQEVIDLDNKYRSIRRAQSTIAHYCHSNDFDMFLTLTLDPKRVKSRFDSVEAMEIMTKWLTAQRKKYGKFHYIVVPEAHANGAIHFHAVFKGYNGKIKEATTRNNRKVYHLEEWKHGFSDCEYIEDIGKVANYIRSYITKDLNYLFGKKKYLVSHGLLKPIIHHNISLDQETEDNLQGKYSNSFCSSGYIRNHSKSGE